MWRSYPNEGLHKSMLIVGERVVFSCFFMGRHVGPGHLSSVAFCSPAKSLTSNFWFGGKPMSWKVDVLTSHGEKCTTVSLQPPKRLAPRPERASPESPRLRLRAQALRGLERHRGLREAPEPGIGQAQAVPRLEKEGKVRGARAPNLNIFWFLLLLIVSCLVCFAVVLVFLCCFFVLCVFGFLP